MTSEDRDYAFRHAFAYADSHVSTDDAIAYGHYYADLVSRESDMQDWPAHSEIFQPWRRRMEAAIEVIRSQHIGEEPI